MSFLVYAVVFGVTGVLDIVWWCICAGSLWDGTFIDGGTQEGIRRVVIIAVFVNWVVKIGAIVFSVLNHRREGSTLKAGPGY